MSQVQRGGWECKFGSFQQKRVLEPMRQDSNAKELIQVKNEKVQGLSPEQQRLSTAGGRGRGAAGGRGGPAAADGEMRPEKGTWMQNHHLDKSGFIALLRGLA